MPRNGTLPRLRLLQCKIGQMEWASSDSLESPPLYISKFLPALVPALLAAAPAHASGGTPLPEPSGLFLLSMGVAGVIIGRRLSSKRRED